MSKVLLFSDLHLHPHKRKQERLEDCIAALNWVFDVAEQHSIKDILFGGDFFHDRQKIEVYTYQRAFETMQNRLRGKKFNMYLLLGNHDLWFNDKTSVTSVIPFSALPGVQVISMPERLEIAGSTWDFIPFTHDPISTLENLKKKPGKPQYALGHIAIDGAILHGTQHADVVIEHDGDMVSIGPSLFDHYLHTFLGHYHAEQRVNSKVEYIGSPLELSFGEAYQKKHIIILDVDTNEKEYVENTFSPKHLVISYKEKDKYNLTKNFVKIKVEDMGSTDLIAMKKEILEQGNLGSLEILPMKKEIDEHVIENAKAILYKGKEMLSKYLDEVGCKELDRTRLLEIGEKICTMPKE